ncbi:MAG: transpeptidase family protein [Bacteroidetes bacterium]|nr:transpeptidase family protein [Bacteroidota bacterium]
MSLFIIIFALIIIAQAFELTVTNREEYVKLSKEQSIRLRDVKAIRGNILSNDGRLLATSLPKYDIRFDTRASKISDELFRNEVDSLAILLSMHFPDKNFNLWRNYLLNGRKNKERYLLIHRNVSYEIAKDMSDWPIFRMGKFAGGLIKEEHNVREMPFGRMARRTIGFTSRAGNSVGLELSFDSLLRGKSGKRYEQRVSANVWRPIEGDEFEPENGYDIVTTIDINIQDVAEDALRRALDSANAMSGCAILMEVETGAIRAIANFNRMKDGSYFESMNLAIGDASDPGSTFKLASALALLEEGFIELDDSIDINYGKMQFYDRTMEDAHNSPHKKITFRDAFEFSSNVGIAGLVEKFFKNNPQRYIDYLSRLNLDRPLGIELRGEGNIRIKSPKDKDWNLTTLPWTAIGYESRVTALQILNIYNTIANNGRMVRPFFVSEIRKTGKSFWKHEVDIINEKVCSQATIDKLKELLVGVVERGTARNLKNLEYKVAGKTGTAQLYRITGFDKNSHKASFVGYFPADKPKYSCIIVVNEPRKGGYYGNIIAGPVFREIADKVYATLLDIHPEVEPDENIILPIVKDGYRDDIKFVLNTLQISSNTKEGNNGSEWVRANRQQNYISLTPKEFNKNRMPDVKGMGIRDALYLLESMGLQVITQGYGWIKYQSLPPNTPIYPGNKVFIELKP